MTPKNNN